MGVSYHWPKSIYSQIRSIRDQLSKFDNGTINLTDKFIMIRPANSGKALTISYKMEGSKEWTTLETVRTPVPKAIIEKSGLDQVCVSTYFKI